jgi:hypothetical protein
MYIQSAILSRWKQGFDSPSRSLKNPRVYGRDVIRCAGVGKP